MDMDRYTRGCDGECEDRKTGSSKVVEQIIAEGVPHHYSLVWDDVAAELKEIYGLLEIPVIEA